MMVAPFDAGGTPCISASGKEARVTNDIGLRMPYCDR